jgi:hypothetical protein
VSARPRASPSSGPAPSESRSLRAGGTAIDVDRSSLTTHVHKSGVFSRESVVSDLYRMGFDPKTRD